jgi:hypothetical protein
MDTTVPCIKAIMMLKWMEDIHRWWRKHGLNKSDRNCKLHLTFQCIFNANLNLYSTYVQPGKKHSSLISCNRSELSFFFVERSSSSSFRFAVKHQVCGEISG